VKVDIERVDRWAAADLEGIGDINNKISFPIALYEVGPDLTAYLAAEGDGIGFGQVVAGIASKDVAGAFAAAKTIPKETYDAAITTGRPQLQKLYADYFNANGVDAVVFPTTPLPARPINPTAIPARTLSSSTAKRCRPSPPTFATPIPAATPRSQA